MEEQDDPEQEETAGKSVQFDLDKNQFYSPVASRNASIVPSDLSGSPGPGATGRKISFDSPPMADWKAEEVASTPAAPQDEATAGEEATLTRLVEAVRSGRQLSILLEILQAITPQSAVGEPCDATTGRTILHECAAHLAAGQEGFLVKLVQEASTFGLDIDAPDQSSGNMTALHLACAMGKEKIAQTFVIFAPLSSIHETNPAGWAAIHFIAAKNRDGVLEALLKRLAGDGADTLHKALTMAIPKSGFTPLSIALKAKASTCCMMLLDRVESIAVTGREPSSGMKEQSSTTTRISLLDIQDCTPAGLFPIHTACANGFPFYNVTTRILELDAGSVRKVDKDGRTALHHALQGGHGRVSVLLLNSGADATVGDLANGVSPLHLVASSNDAGLMGIIMEKRQKSAEASGAWSLEVRDVAQRTPVIAAAIHGSHKTLGLLLDAGADANAKGEDHACALHWALKNKRKEAAMTLLERKAELSFKDAYGNTPLMIACFNGKPFASVAELIADRAPEFITVADEQGRCPLHWAAAHGHAQLVSALLDGGASSFVCTTKEKIYPLHWAAQQAQFDAVEMFYYDAVNTHEVPEAEAMNVVDAGGRTPLHWICQRLADDERNAMSQSGGDGSEVARATASGNFDPQQQEAEPLSIYSAQRVLNFLVEHGGDMDKDASNGVTPRNILEVADLGDMIPGGTAKHEGEESSGGFGNFGGGTFGNDDNSEDGDSGGFCAFGEHSQEEDGDGDGGGGFCAFGDQSEEEEGKAGASDQEDAAQGESAAFGFSGATNNGSFPTSGGGTFNTGIHADEKATYPVGPSVSRRRGTAYSPPADEDEDEAK